MSNTFPTVQVANYLRELQPTLGRLVNPEHLSQMQESISDILLNPNANEKDWDKFWQGCLHMISDANQREAFYGQILAKSSELSVGDTSEVAEFAPVATQSDPEEVIALFVALPAGTPVEEAQNRERLIQDLMNIPGNEDNVVDQTQWATTLRDQKLAQPPLQVSLPRPSGPAPVPAPVERVVTRRSRPIDPESDDEAVELADKAAYYHGSVIHEEQLIDRIHDLGWSIDSPIMALRMIEARVRKNQQPTQALAAPVKTRKQVHITIPPRVANAIKQFGLLVAITLLGALLIGALVGAGAYRYDDRPRVDNSSCVFGENAPHLNCHVDNPPVNWRGVVIRWAGIGAIAGAAGTLVLVVAIRQSRKKKESSGDNEIGL